MSSRLTIQLVISDVWHSFNVLFLEWTKVRHRPESGSAQGRIRFEIHTRRNGVEWNGINELILLNPMSSVWSFRRDID